MELEQTVTKENNTNLSYKYITTKPNEGNKRINIFTKQS
jgi:hypothetical protein